MPTTEIVAPGWQIGQEYRVRGSQQMRVAARFVELLNGEWSIYDTQGAGNYLANAVPTGGLDEAAIRAYHEALRQKQENARRKRMLDELARRRESAGLSRFQRAIRKMESK